MNSSTVRKLFLAAFVILPLQYALVGLASLLGHSEPYPAVVLPAFQSVWGDSTGVSVRNPQFEVHFRDGGEESVTPDAVFSLIPASHHLGIMRTHFQPSVEPAPSTRAWLGDRLEELYSRRPERVDVVWYMMQWEPVDGSASLTASDTLSLNIPESEDR